MSQGHLLLSDRDDSASVVMRGSLVPFVLSETPYKPEISDGLSILGDALPINPHSRENLEYVVQRSGDGDCIQLASYAFRMCSGRLSKATYSWNE